MPEETLFEFEQTMSRAEVARYLRTLAKHLEKDGSINFTAGTRESTVEVPARVEFEIEVERETEEGKPAEMSIELEIEWTEGEEDASLQIS
mgnify:CR=1 FL=1